MNDWHVRNTPCSVPTCQSFRNSISEIRLLKDLMLKDGDPSIGRLDKRLNADYTGVYTEFLVGNGVIDSYFFLRNSTISSQPSLFVRQVGRLVEHSIENASLANQLARFVLQLLGCTGDSDGRH
jgi:hypothetical protein